MEDIIVLGLIISMAVGFSGIAYILFAWVRKTFNSLKWPESDRIGISFLFFFIIIVMLVLASSCSHVYDIVIF